ncbi:MAG: hypothetical protein DYH20_05270 [Gammaproteobacteria bacterium PRO9]|nr:hypothetical protein [Gammaproteobacteria bacterium PRO9]
MDAPNHCKGHKVIFLAPVATQPRYGKRITEILKLGVEAECLYFDRDYFSGRQLPCHSICLGRVSHGKYVFRILTLVKSIFVARRYLREATISYAFGVDMLFLSAIASVGCKNRIVYEVSDIRDAMTKPGIQSWLLRGLEKLLLRRVDLVVVTAPGYRDGYYRGLGVSSGNRFFVMENKLDLDPAKRPQRVVVRPENGPITIGYFGLLRCRRSWDVLKELVRKGQGKFVVKVRGRPIAPDSLPAEAEALDGIQYDGEFVWPDDLAAMYDSVDLVWGCYPHSNQPVGNWLWARTNRFYEACYFKRPIVTLEGSADARIAEELGIGPVVDLNDTGAAVDRLLQLTFDEVADWQGKVDQVGSDVCVYGDDHQRLLRLITSLDGVG